MKALYTANATATAGREGTVKTDDGKLSFKLSKPGSSDGTNPEQLFACAYASCFSGAASHIAKQQGYDVGSIPVTASVTLNQVENGFLLSAVLDVQLTNVDQAVAQKIIRDAHEFCPYSRATRGDITVQLKLNGADLS